MTSKTVSMARGLSFPAAEFATEVVASLGMRGGGKSNGAAVIILVPPACAGVGHWAWRDKRE